MRSPYGNYCTPIISASQEVFMWYSIISYGFKRGNKYMEEKPRSTTSQEQSQTDLTQSRNDTLVSQVGAPQNHKGPDYIDNQSSQQLNPPSKTTIALAKWHLWRARRNFPRPDNPRWTDHVMAWATVVMALATIGIGALAYRQWKDSGALTDAATKAAAAAEKFQTSAANIDAGVKDAVGKLDAQTKATIEALHVSERAYVAMTGSPVFDEQTRAATLIIRNIGRIPSGEVEATTHELTAYFGTPPVKPITEAQFQEFHWSRLQLDSIPTESSPALVTVPIRLFSKYDVETGHQSITIAGTVRYKDGFPDDPIAEWPFCWKTIYYTVLKSMVWIQCDPKILLPQLEKIDGYPNKAHYN